MCASHIACDVNWTWLYTEVVQMAMCIFVLQWNVICTRLQDHSFSLSDLVQFVSSSWRNLTFKIQLPRVLGADSKPGLIVVTPSLQLVLKPPNPPEPVLCS